MLEILRRRFQAQPQPQQRGRTSTSTTTGEPTLDSLRDQLRAKDETAANIAREMGRVQGEQRALAQRIAAAGTANAETVQLHARKFAGQEIEDAEIAAAEAAERAAQADAERARTQHAAAGTVLSALNDAMAEVIDDQRKLRAAALPLVRELLAQRARDASAAATRAALDYEQARALYEGQCIALREAAAAAGVSDLTNALALPVRDPIPTEFAFGRAIDSARRVTLAELAAILGS